MKKKLYEILARTVLSSLFIVAACASAQAQSAKDEERGDEKAEAVLSRAVEALGGRAYLDVRTVVSEGRFTPFQDGAATLPIKFTDYLSFPDRERTEFKGMTVHAVETHVAGDGWSADLKKKVLTDRTPEQAENFRVAMRTSIDNILRGWWRKEGARLSYAGRREAGLARRNETVRLAYTDGFNIEFEFDARTGLPSKVLYKRVNAEGVETEEEDRYAQFISIGGVQVPFVIDHFRAGVQTSRVNYETVEFNRTLPDSLFARPADVKSLK